MELINNNYRIIHLYKKEKGALEFMIYSGKLETEVVLD